MSPGNMLRWYVQFRPRCRYMAWRSRWPPLTSSSACATMFWISQLCREKVCSGMQSPNRLAMKSEE